ncbi:LCCL domain-containing protein [Arthroderma uncinatum]|uniref:LCCL domain-containing protein n=1 Tax=Arthroderma uncinatum TaxID=74035 RepID=UPI00144AE904|nr:LCCL domain-containing protein [Arthroderma uncinatum]KAF3479416.1 LCCL domain-containing protein [Arthroderma uncinatum]
MPDDHRPDVEGGALLSGQPAASIDDHDPDRANNDNLLPFGLANDGASVMPVWLAESSKSFRWGWVPLPLRKAARVTVRWLKGPEPPHELRFEPLFPGIQQAPVVFLERYFPKKKQKIFLLLGLYFAWFLSWSLTLRHSVSSGHIEGYGKPGPIACSANYCVQLLNPYIVGNETLNYQPLIVGGPAPGAPGEEGIYRADSYVCQAAIHAGVISAAHGGCGVVKLVGSSHEYYGSEANGFNSTGFPSTFPKSFSFVKLEGKEFDCPPDMRWVLLAITATTLALLSIFTTSPAIFFFSTFVILIMHVGLVSDPPGVSGVPELLSLLFSRLLPASFVAYVLYLYCAVPLLKPLSSPPVYQITRTILYLGPAFIGALNNYTFATWIPIQRLTPHDIQNQPGAPLALAIVLTIVITIVLTQAWQIRQGGLFFHFIRIYFVIAVSIIILLALPGLRLRIHHYILAILLMPGTAIPTRPSIIYQGLLLGLFVHGVGRWGFASIIETPNALGELPSAGTWWGATTPSITNSSVTVSLASPHERHYYPGNGNITFKLWDREEMNKLQVEGVSVLVNDVERWRGYVDETRKGKFTWHRRGLKGLSARDLDSLSKLGEAPLKDDDEDDDDDDDDYNSPPQDLFFRFAYLRGSSAGLYSGAGVWLRDGTWVPPPPRE